MAKRVDNEKDTAQMNLEGYNDVFADVINAFLFEGKREVREEELEEAPTRSSYKGKRTRTQERDLAKYWKRTEIRIFFGTENQMGPDVDMPLRVIGYDGAAYRDQLYYVKGKNGKRRRNHNPRYPVITLVLYFGYKKHWDKPKKLKEVLKNVPEALDPYVNDYEIHVFEVAWMTEEQLQLLKSDFRFVADYFMQMFAPIMYCLGNCST